MKKYILGLSIAASSLSLSSCLGDLDTVPLNETDKTIDQVYATLADYEMGLAYIYGSFCLVSQTDPGSADIDVPDAGQSEMIRQYIVLNEMSTDALKCPWGDTYVADLTNTNWTSAPNNAMYTVYTRCMMIVTRANEFLNQSGKDIEGLKELRAEARFLRALGYYILMDLFGNPPFALPENIGGKLPSQIGRTALFEWIETELKAIINCEGGEMIPVTNDYPRASKGSAWAVLARMYLNGKVYTGKEYWTEAKAAATEVINMGYKLCSDYSHIFMQDNGENADARNEFIFAIAYDRDKTQSYGGTTCMINASVDDAARIGIAAALGYPEGSKIARDQWNGYHVPDEFVSANYEMTGIEWGATSGLGYNREHSDKRAMFYNINCSQTFDKANANSGWRCWKFNSMESNGNLCTDENKYTVFSSSDFPMFRLAEMYLIYAEAQARLDGGSTSDATAVGYIKALRTRAGLSCPATIDTDFILKERACELFWEGHRRTDLIRYGYYTSISHPWPYKGGVPDGKVELASYRTVYPLPISDLSENPNLVQNTGY